MFFVFVQSLWREGNRATVSRGITCIIAAPKPHERRQLIIPSGILRLKSARGSSQEVLKVVTYVALISDSLPWRKWTQDIHLPCCPAVQSLCSVWCTCCLLAIFFGGGFALLHSDCKWPVKWQLKHSESLYLHLSGVWMVAQFAEIVFHARRDVDPPSDRITTCCRTWPVWATASSAASWKVKLPDNNSPTNLTILYPGFWFAEWNRYLYATFKWMDL